MSSTATASRPPMVPHHKMVRAIGRGSYGEIWLARSLTGAWRAVKIVDRRRFEDERSFEREFAGMASFEPVSREHEGFVDILHVGRSDDDAFFYYVMELADDVVPRSPFDPNAYQPKTLKSELARVGRMQADQVIALGLSLTEALAELHGHALVHRDIKPANIIFCGGAPKVADIGLVSAMGQNSFVGTEGYVPPEGPGNEQSDIYSLGKVLYEIAMGKDRMQFPEMNTRLSEFPDREMLLRLNEVLLRACANSATERYATAQAMHDDLLRARDGLPLSGRPRNRRRLGISLALLAIAAAFFAFLAHIFAPAGKGDVYFEVDPPEASIFFLGTPGSSKVDLKNAPAGKHKLSIVHPEFENVETTVTIKADDATRLPKFVLQPALRPLVVDSVPGGLAFKLSKGEATIKSGTTPATIEQLHVGEYSLSMTHDGKTKVLPVKLEKSDTPPALIAFGRKKYSISSRPAGAEIFCDDVPVGTAPCEIELPEGPHKLVARYKSWPEQTRDINAEPGEPEGQAFAFIPGSVKVASRPKGATVYKGGVRLGVTPCLIESLDPGEAIFDVKLAGFRDARVQVNVRPNSMGDFAEVDFEKRPGPRPGERWENGLGMKFAPVGDVLFAVWPTRVADFRAFAEATNFALREPDFAQTPDHPVINVNWDDAKAFCAWLTASEKKAGRLDENQSYRLPTDAEWSAAAGIPDEGGTTPEQRDGQYKKHLWGSAWPPPKGAGNFADSSVKKGPNIPGYSDGWVQTSPVGSFPAMENGLFDMTGNVWQWVEDSYRGPQGRKTWGVLRGGSWGTVQQNELQLGYRDVVDRSERDPIFGFRCVIETGK